MYHLAASCFRVWTPCHDCGPPEGCRLHRTGPLSRNALNICWVEMKEKIACNWQLPSWVLSSWEVPAWAFRSSSQIVKPLPKDRFLDSQARAAALSSRHRSVAAGTLWQACSDQRREASRLPGKLADEQSASVWNTEALQGLGEERATGGRSL